MKIPRNAVMSALAVVGLDRDAIITDYRLAYSVPGQWALRLRSRREFVMFVFALGQQLARHGGEQYAQDVASTSELDVTHSGDIILFFNRGELA